MSFRLTPKQNVQIKEWDADHENSLGQKCVEPDTAIGGRTTFSFTPTSIGVVVRIRCACGWTIDVSDYEDW